MAYKLGPLSMVILYHGWEKMVLMELDFILYKAKIEIINIINNSMKNYKQA